MVCLPLLLLYHMGGRVPEPKYRLRPGAQQELEEEQARVLRLVAMHLITAAQGRTMLFEAIKKFCASTETMEEVQSGDTFPILCTGCGKVVIVASDVIDYRCKCSPEILRFTFQSRKLDAKIGKGAIESLLDSSYGRNSFDLLL